MTSHVRSALCTLLHFLKTKEFLFQEKFINVVSRLASIMKGMINPFLVGIGILDNSQLSTELNCD